MMLDGTTAYVVGVLFVASAIRTVLGFGEALVAVPLLALRLPVAVAAPLAVAVSVLIALLIVARDWRHVELRSAGWLATGSFAGIPIGVFLLARVDDHVVKALLGLLIAGFGLYSARGIPAGQLQGDRFGWLLGTGFTSGILGGAYGMNGPPLAVYGTLRGWSPSRFRATLQGYFLLASLAGLAGYAALGLLTASVGAYFLLALPGVLGGVFAGRLLSRRMKARQFFRVVCLGLVMIGIVLATEGLR